VDGWIDGWMDGWMWCCIDMLLKYGMDRWMGHWNWISIQMNAIQLMFNVLFYSFLSVK